MPQETNDGIAYLMALKQGTSASATGLAKESAKESHEGSPSEGTSGSYQGAEKRRSPRYKCEGSAEMCESTCEVHTWATFTDISMHGCYVEAQATYPVGTVLRLKLEVNAFRVEMTGNVRVSYPYLGMGIAFVEITPENQSRLKDLLLSLSRPSVIIGPGIPSTLPACGPLEGVPKISDPGAAVQVLLDFFRDRQLLLRDEFLRILRQSQCKQ